jgi:hypothetical protein
LVLGILYPDDLVMQSKSIAANYLVRIGCLVDYYFVVPSATSQLMSCPGAELSLTRHLCLPPLLVVGTKESVVPVLIDYACCLRDHLLVPLYCKKYLILIFTGGQWGVACKKGRAKSLQLLYWRNLIRYDVGEEYNNQVGSSRYYIL